MRAGTGAIGPRSNARSAYQLRQAREMATGRSWYYVDEAGDNHGPISEEDLVARLREGTLQRWVKVRFEGMHSKDPIRADSIPYLVEKLKSAEQVSPERKAETTARSQSHEQAFQPTPGLIRSRPKSNRPFPEKVALTIGYAFLATVALGVLLWVIDDFFWLVLGIGTFAVMAPIAVLLNLLIAAIAGAVLALPFRPLMEQERWDRVATAFGITIWILVGVWLALKW